MIDENNELLWKWLKDDITRQLNSDKESITFLLSEERIYLLSRVFDVITKQLKELE